MSSNRTSWLILSTGLMVVALVLSSACIAALAGLAFPFGPLLAQGYDRAAERAAHGRPADLRGARLESQEALRLAPYDTRARLRLAAMADRLGEMQDMLRQLQVSYNLVAYDPAVSFDRASLALSRWDALTPPLRTSLESEVRTLAATPEGRIRMLAAMKRVENPLGKRVAEAWIGQASPDPSVQTQLVRGARK